MIYLSGSNSQQILLYSSVADELKVSVLLYLFIESTLGCDFLNTLRKHYFWQHYHCQHSGILCFWLRVLTVCEKKFKNHMSSFLQWWSNEKGLEITYNSDKHETCLKSHFAGWKMYPDTHLQSAALFHCQFHYLPASNQE